MTRLSEKQIYSNLRVFLECQQAATVKKQLEVASPVAVARVLSRFPDWQADLMLSLLENDDRSRIEAVRIYPGASGTSPRKSLYPFSHQTH
ncbi:MAG: hypothetical protein LAT55_02075 [Opitutales bacterium]|nr:hypothetical protein [Opitutales bacterium]